MNKKFFIKTFGCQINFLESKKIFNILKSCNFLYVDNFNLSDIIIINSCCVRQKVYKKIFFFIKKALKINNNFIIVIGGCLSVLFINLLIKKNYINIIFNSYSIYYISKLINLFFYNCCKQICINFYNKNLCNYNFNKNYNFYITIMEGCNKYCSYCIVPFTKGFEISKNLFSILYKLINFNNIKKIFLLGHNVNSYKGYLNFKSKKKINFIFLIYYLTELFNVKIINYISSFPIFFNDNFLKIYKKNFKLSNFLHLPIQSCSDKILFFMYRNYNLSKYKIIINCLKFFKINFFFSTDIIIGFPCENYIDYNKTLIFIEKFLFDKSYIFLYSPRPYTESFFFYNYISLQLKKNRFNKVYNKIKNNVFYINKYMIGKIEFVFVDNFCLFDDNFFFGYTSNNRKIKFYFLWYYKFKIMCNFVKIKILKRENNFFLGKLIF